MNPTIPRLLYAGESCIVVEFGEGIDLGVNARVQTLRKKIEASPFRGFVDTVPTYRSLAVCFDPLNVGDLSKLEKHLLTLSEDLEASVQEEAEVVVVPVCYEGEFAPDLERVAANAGISPSEVVRLHASKDCYCYMLGFVPGYSYLGGMDPALETPRLKEPREKIPAGSVAIGGKQTGIYPIESPGGWNIIGKTPLCLFDPDRSPAIFLNAGMWVHFEPISRDVFERQAAEARLSSWRPIIERRKVNA